MLSATGARPPDASVDRRPAQEKQHPAAPGRPAPGGAQGTAYAMAAARDEARLVAAARPGTRNDTLNRAAFSLGQLTAAGLSRCRSPAPRSPAQPNAPGCPPRRHGAPSGPD